MSSTPKMKVAVGVITRRRASVLRGLLGSFVAMERPDDIELLFIVVENDDAATLDNDIAAFQAQVVEQVICELQPRPGIPAARNAVMDRAMAENCDRLIFVDDDERVRPDWLVRLIGGAGPFELAGGPVRIVAASPVGGWAAVVLSALQARAEKRMARRARAQGRLDIYTNNWIADLSAVRRLGIRFDEALQFTGGSDTAFSRAFAQAGGVLGWIPDAVVEDRWPPERLTLRYVFTRSRDQAINAQVVGRRSLAAALAQALACSLRAVLRLASGLWRGRVAIVEATREAGMAIGRLSGAFGRRSDHYARR